MGLVIDMQWHRDRSKREAAHERYEQMMRAEAESKLPTINTWWPVAILVEDLGLGLTTREVWFLCDNGLPHWRISPRRALTQPETMCAWLREFMPDPALIDRLPVPRRRGPIAAGLRNRVLTRDGRCCVECGATEDLAMDHIKPGAHGGRTTFENLQTLCTPCNSRKSDRWGGDE